MANLIVQENLLSGNPESEWDLAGAGSTTIEGFATDFSVNRGQMVSFKINTPATSLVRLLNTPASQLAQVLQARVEKG